MPSFNPRRILVPTDFSATASYAFCTATKMAMAFGAELIVVHCAPDPAGENDSPDPEPRFSVESEVELLERLQLYADEHIAGRGVPYRVRVIHEGPVVGITSMAEQLDAELIVIGSHGLTGWHRTVLGSVSEGVMRSTSRAVLTVRDELKAPLTRILCPVTFSATSRNALDHASSLTLALDAELLVVHVAELDSQPLDQKTELRSWIPERVKNRSRYTECTGRGNGGEEIIAFAERHDASLIVLGSQHKRSADQSAGDITSEWLARHSTRPVLTVVSSPGKREVSESWLARTSVSA